jgi:hypothetical protein
MRGKKIIVFLVCVLMITSGILLMPQNMDVRADDYQHHNGENEIGLNTTYVWEMVKQFCNVTKNADWSQENNIPKGRSWATAGENYTIDHILKPQWENFTDPVFQKLPIGYIDEDPYKNRLYSNKIVIQDFNLTIENPSKTIPISEMFPIGIGDDSKGNNLNGSYGFNEAKIKELDLFKYDFLGGSYFTDHLNVSTQFLNTGNLIGGSPVFLDQNDTVPEIQNDLVFIMNETEDCNNKLDNISTAVACILINSPSFGYSYEEADEKQFPIVRVDKDDDNLTEVLSEIENGSVYFVDNNYDSDTLVFTNLSNDTCVPNEIWVYVIQRLAPSDKNSTDSRWNFTGAYYDFMRLQIRHIFWYLYNYSVLPWGETKGCKGFILSDYTNTHFMTHTVKGWGTADKLLTGEDESWFPGFTDRWWFPMFSVNKSVGEFLRDNKWSARVTGFIEQEYRCQTTTKPGVISHNFIGYRNISQDPTDPVVILSNRIDGWWGQTPGDSGVGGAILLGIAKYFNDYNITPKYNLRFLFTTGEEYGMRGAQHYNDSHPHDDTTHPNDNIIRWIGFDQLGFDYTTSDDTINLTVNVLDTETKAIIETIADDTQYVNRTGYGTWVDTPDGYGSEDKVFKTRKNCDTICFGKDNSSRWDNYHRSGENYSEGDSLNHTDRNDVNVTFELAWNVTKYFTVNPDCWFSDISYQAVDSPYDDDVVIDSINATFTIHTILPNDKIQIIASLWPEYYWKPVTYANVSMNYTVTPANITDTITVTLPPGNEAGNYWLRLSLYNSTGRINLITKISNLEDDYNNSQCYNLSPRDNDPPATPHKPTESAILLLALNEYNYTTNTTDPNQDQVQYEWDWLADTTHQYETTGFYPSGANCTLSHAYNFGENKCIKVRAIDQYGAESNWSEPLDLFMQQFTSFDMTSQDYVAVVSQPSTYYGYIYGNIQEPENWTWNFIGCSKGAENYTSYTQNTEKTFTVLSDYNVTLTVTDVDTSAVNITRTITTKNLHSEFTTNYNGSIPPGNTIAFINQSIGRYSITNQTWDFDDGIRSYEKNPTHVYTTPGVYNVTLTVRDSQSNNDTSYQLLSIHTDETPPEIQLVTHELAINQNWFTVGLAAFINDHDSGIDQVSVNITYPDQTYGNYTMVHLFNNVYSYMFNDTDIVGDYNYTIWVIDHENNTNCATGYSFTIPTPPFLLYATTTPDNNTVSNDPWADVNVTVLDPVNTSAFIDWDNSLKGYWPMESYNNTGVYDNSTYDNFGVFQNGLNTRNIMPGKYGKGLEFDGINHYVDVGNSDSLNLGSGDFTFMVWEKSHTSSYSGNAVILTNQPAQEDWKGYGFGVIEGAYLFISQSPEDYVEVKGTIDVTDDTWHHLAYVHHDGYYSLYVDGIYDTDSKLVTTEYNITNAQNTCLAYDGQTPGWCYFAGMLDEPQLYNRALSREEINASYNNGLYQLYHNFTGLTEGTYSYYAHAIDTTGNMSETEVRAVTIDFDPQITTVSASPHTVGFGFNVTISANVTDSGSGVNTVNVNITYPDHTYGNYTMSHTTGNTYQYVFSSTWQTGQYNFTIWATDHSNNSNSSTGHHFHVSADVTISIATLKNSYSGSQYINITDPPNPLENYTLVGRGLTWDEYYNAITGQNILEVSTGPINYQEDNSTWTPINNSLRQLTSNHPAYNYGYRTGNDRGLFGVYFKPNAQNDWPVAFTYNRSDDPTTHAVRSKLVGVGYVDPQSNWTYQYLQNVQSSQGQLNDYSITYPGVFTGTDVTWSYGNTGLKEEITISNTTKTVLQNHPPSQYGLNDASSYLVFITKLEHQNLNLYNDSGLLDGNVTISDNGVEFKDALGQFTCAMPIGEAYELNNESVRQKLTYRIVHLNGNTYLLSGLKVSDLNAMTFPVVIDPTLTVYSTSSDGYIYNSDTNYNAVQTASTGTVNSSGAYITIGQKMVSAGLPGMPATYSIYRGFVFFNTSALPSNAYLDNATLSLYKKDDYSATDFDITIQNGQPTYPHDPMQSGDYNKNDYSGNGGTLNTSKFTNGYNDIQVSNLNWITKGGTTKLCLRSSRDINGNEPTGNEYANVHSSEFLGMCGPKLVIMYRNQSKIKNTGSTDIKGYLLIQVQFYNTSQSKWLLDNDTVNETSPRTINIGSQLALDTIFNGKIRASNLQHGTGTYRVYTAFRDPEGNILKTNTGSELKAWWQFSKT